MSSTDVSSPACPICYEASPDLLPLRQCSHAACGSCLVQWIETVEASDGNGGHLPSCPYCNTAMTRDEAESILGRPYTPATKSRTTANDEEMDEFTRHLLEQTTRPCPHCGAWIEKVPDTCHKMACLCGYQFCYTCGAQGADCDCHEEERCHAFWDNILDRPPDTPDDEVLVAQRDRTGQVDLRRHIRRIVARDQHQDYHTQRNRMVRRYQLQNEIETVHPLISSAPWLFASNSRTASLAMLTVQIEMAMQHQSRQCPVCDIWNTRQPLSDGRVQLLGTVADVFPAYDDRRGIGAVTFHGDICRCSCGAPFCVDCGLLHPRTCRHGKHIHCTRDIDDTYDTDDESYSWVTYDTENESYSCVQCSIDNDLARRVAFHESDYENLEWQVKHKSKRRYERPNKDGGFVLPSTKRKQKASRAMVRSKTCYDLSRLEENPFT